ncbi:MAG: GH92 family glycosyl hydrolase [Aerococcaceae bacterium]|nr:GH92 family glycosyl hydrolase [Aerococcaceae bacterium]
MKRVNTIDTRYGTQNHYQMGHGNTLPYTGTPFGMNHFVMQTRSGDVRFFHPEDYSNYGIRLTHQPSPWMGDFAYQLWNVVAMTDEEYEQLVTSEDGHWQLDELLKSGYRPQEAQFRPHYLAYRKLRDQLQVELCADPRGASIRITKHVATPPKLLLAIGVSEKAPYQLANHHTLLKTYTNQLSGSKYHQCGMYHAIQADAELSFVRTTTSKLGAHPMTLLWFELNTPQSVCTFNWTTSYISHEHAIHYQQQTPFFALDWQKKCEASAELWETYLNKVEVSHSDPHKVAMFNHCLYRTATFPQMAYEKDTAGNVIHYSPYTGKVEPGYFYTNNGYWDTFRTNYPLYALLIPEKIPEFLEGIVAVAREDRYLPKWLSPDERGLMPGTLVDAVIADAVVKGLVSEALAEELLGAMIYTAEVESEHELEGREGTQQYQTLGYLSTDYHESVNKTLDYAYSDFCIYQVAHHLGKTDIAQRYGERCYSYRHLFDSASGMMKPRRATGEFLSGIADHRWGQHYTEGSAWQNSLAVYHNIADLIQLYGGDEAFYQHLETLVNMEPLYQVGGYRMEIHEMLEMATISFGQLALSNQPSFHIPYLFIYAGYPHMTHLLIKRLCEQLFCPTYDGFVGDEDNGSLSSWYVLSSLGLYSVTPGTTEYVLGMCQWNKAMIHFSNGKTLQIESTWQEPHLQVVQSRSWNGEQLLDHMIDYQTLMQGGALTQTLGTIPSIKPIPTENRPFSFTKR